MIRAIWSGANVPDTRPGLSLRHPSIAAAGPTASRALDADQGVEGVGPPPPPDPDGVPLAPEVVGDVPFSAVEGQQDDPARWANPCGQERDRAIVGGPCCRSVMTTLAAFPGMESGSWSLREKMGGLADHRKIAASWKVHSAGGTRRTGPPAI